MGGVKKCGTEHRITRCLRIRVYRVREKGETLPKNDKSIERHGTGNTRQKFADGFSSYY